MLCVADVYMYADETGDLDITGAAGASRYSAVRVARRRRTDWKRGGLCEPCFAEKRLCHGRGGRPAIGLTVWGIAALAFLVPAASG